MKVLILVCLALTLFLLITPKIYAQTASPSPLPSSQTSSTNEFTVQNEPSSIITLLKSFIDGFDSLLGGFIFYTPNALSDTVLLKDKSEIPGVTKYRTMFYQIAIPVLAIIIAAIAITKIGSENVEQLKSFVKRFVIVIALFLIVPFALTYTIQFNNLLVDKITTTQHFTTFLTDYFDKTQEQIDQGHDSEKYGIPSFDMSLTKGIFRSLGKFIVQVFLFALTFLFLLCGFLYLGFQFVIRFASLLFLGVLYPIIIPFALSERTESVVYTFFKTWFTFLIQQPAFVLGFSIATDIFSSILKSQGPSVGLLFFYTGFLFFLGGVNMLVARLFGDIWTTMSSNMSAALSTRIATSPVQSSLRDFKRGFVGGSVSNNFGRYLRSSFSKPPEDESLKKVANEVLAESNGYTNKVSPAHSNGMVNISKNANLPDYSHKLSHKGLDVQIENSRQGLVSIKGDAYTYKNPKSNLVSYYPTRLDAIQDGVPEEKIEKVTLDSAQFIDLSAFNSKNPNPHSFNVMQEAKKRGKELNYGYITKSSNPQRVKQFFELSKERNEALGIQGVIVEGQSKQDGKPIIRLYSEKDYEKRKNL